MYYSRMARALGSSRAYGWSTPLSALGTDRLFSNEPGAGLCIPRALIGSPLVRLRVNGYLTFPIQLSKSHVNHSWERAIYQYREYTSRAPPEKLDAPTAFFAFGAFSFWSWNREKCDPLKSHGSDFTLCAYVWFCWLGYFSPSSNASTPWGVLYPTIFITTPCTFYFSNNR